MASYFQMGHDTENLVGETELNEFTGIILSPVNREPTELAANVQKFRNGSLYKNNYDIVLDSQLYLPRSNRGCLFNYDYFPSDLDTTADLSSLNWWGGVAKNLADYAINLKVDAVTSPVFLPKTWVEDYYTVCAETSRILSDKLQGTGIRSLFTLMIDLNEIGKKDEALKISSIVSEANPDGYYIVISSDIPPRRELTGEYELAGLMQLIKLLESTDKPVLVSHCSSDLLMFKAAGASHCGTGKFFNLRRFSKSRYEDPSSRGKQIAYWFEQSLLAFLRGPDVNRLKNRGFESLIETGFSKNHWSNKILQQWQQDPNAAWLSLSWRHYLCWFGKTELFLSTNNALDTVNDLLVTAENNWRSIKGVILDEQENDGSWIRNWRQALDEFNRRLES